ncbi:hypothetical protein HZZ02_08375 [Streptococcus danieliae]|nr:hypothetical protein [Streptococcus danieliae]
MNYREVYEVLAREQAISSVAKNFAFITATATVLFGISIFVFLNDKDYMEEFTLKQYFNAWKIAVPILFVSWILLSLTPILTPNLNLIQNLLDK